MVDVTSSILVSSVGGKTPNNNRKTSVVSIVGQSDGRTVLATSNEHLG